MSRRRLTPWALVALAFAAGCGRGAGGGHPATLADAKADAARRGVPILLDFSTTW